LTAANGEDTVSLSGTHSDVQRLTSAVSQVPEVRAERIAALQGKVRSGNFQPDSQKVADAVIAEQTTRKFKA
jgi:flagellar biosynthesis anti-sigma factor FlgM